jgi:hypothetical protein
MFHRTEAEEDGGEDEDEVGVGGLGYSLAGLKMVLNSVQSM